MPAQGNGLGDGNQKIKALKGRDILGPPLQGFDHFMPGDPGRCPGLAWFAPLVLEGGTLSPEEFNSRGASVHRLAALARARLQNLAYFLPMQ